MKQELPPDRYNEILKTLEFQGFIARQIENLGNENINRYDRHRNFNHEYKIETGEITFGESWRVAHLDVEEFQLVYAIKPITRYNISDIDSDGLKEIAMPPRAELYINEFNDEGLISRTLIKDHVGTVAKSRTTIFYANQGKGLIELNRELNEQELIDIFPIIIEPKENIELIRCMVALSEEEQLKANEILAGFEH